MANNAQKKTQESTNLLLVGWSGDGKSATGNSILNGNVFKRNCSTERNDVKIQKESRTVDGKMVYVVDGINLALTRSDGTSDTDKITESLNEALRLCDGSFSALLIVLKHGTQISIEDAEVLKVVKTTLGQDVLSDIGICVISHKDNFLRALKDGEFKTFEHWRDKQIERMKELFNECKDRLVLFDNNTQDEVEKTEQKRKLFNYVNQVSALGGKKLLQQVHQQPKESRDNAVEAKFPQVKKMITREVDPMLRKLGLVGAKKESEAKQSLEALKDDAEDLEQCLSEGLSQVQSLRRDIDAKLGITKSNTLTETAKEFLKQKIGTQKNELERIKRRIKKGEEEPKLLMKELDKLQSKLQKNGTNTQNQRILVEIFKCQQQLKTNLQKENSAASGLSTDEVVHKKQRTDGVKNDNTGTGTGDVMVTSDGTPLTLTIPSVKETAIQRPDSIDLFLVGRPGYGKSATGNSILGKSKFKRNFSVSEDSDTASGGFTIETVEAEGRRLQVIDGPGLDASDEKSREMIVKLLEESLRQFNYEFSALLIVLKFGERFTHADTDAMKVIKSVLGENVIKDHSIVVVTNGDSFEREAEEASEAGLEQTSFEDWCNNQTGDVKHLFEECNFRCVLYNNNTKDDTKKKSQLGSLLSFAKGMKKYTQTDFDRAEVSRKQLLSEAKLPELKKETEELIENIEKAMEDMEHSKLRDVTLHQSRLDDMHRKLDALQNKVKAIGCNYKSFEQLVISVRVCQQRVMTKIKTLLAEKKEAEDTQR